MRKYKLGEVNPVALGIGAGILAVALISSVLALVTDTVQVLGNEVTSQEYAEAEHNLEVALTSSYTSCAGAAYSSNDVVSVGGSNINSGSLDLTSFIETGTAGLFNVSRVCVRNATGNEIDGELTVTLLARSSVEIGACNGTEQQAEAALGTPTCANGEAGELANATAIQVQDGALRCDQSSPPATAVARFTSTDPVGTTVELGASAGSTFVMADGQECILVVAVSIPGSQPSDQLLAATTDNLAFDLAISLRDVTP